MLSKRILLMLLMTLFLVVLVSCQSTSEEREETATPAAQLSPEQRLDQIKAELKEVKKELTKAGKYDCCIQPTCNWCALHEGACECHDNLKANKEVCPGCGLGWHNGKGVVEGISAKQVKWNIAHEHEGEEHGE